MKKQIVALAAAMLLLGSGTAMAESKEVAGEVTEVLGNKVTIEISNGMAKDISVGDKVKVEVEKKAAKKQEKKPAAMGGMDMLQGC